MDNNMTSRTLKQCIINLVLTSCPGSHNSNLKEGNFELNIFNLLIFSLFLLRTEKGDLIGLAIFLLIFCVWCHFFHKHVTAIYNKTTYKRNTNRKRLLCLNQ